MLGTEEDIPYPTSFGTIPSISMKQLLRSYPIVVEMRAKIDTILPFLGPITISARGISKAESSSPSGLAGQVPLPVFDLVGTWSTPTPQPTTNATATATATPGQSTNRCPQSALFACHQQCVANGDSLCCPYVYDCETCIACGT